MEPFNLDEGPKDNGDYVGKLSPTADELRLILKQLKQLEMNCFLILERPRLFPEGFVLAPEDEEKHRLLMAELRGAAVLVERAINLVK